MKFITLQKLNGQILLILFYDKFCHVFFIKTRNKNKSDISHREVYAVIRFSTKIQMWIFCACESASGHPVYVTYIQCVSIKGYPL